MSQHSACPWLVFIHLAPVVGAVVLHQSGVPPDKLGQIRERKKLVEQILAKDSDEMKHTVDVSSMCSCCGRGHKRDSSHRILITGFWSAWTRLDV